VRNGVNFTERGFGVRGALGVSDRGHTAAAQMRDGDCDWDHLFGHLGVRWFHTGGIFSALSDSTPAVVEAAVSSARRHGTVVSYDLNYRPSLWQSIGGKARAQEVNRRLAPLVDVMIGNEEDFTACLGLTVEGVDDRLVALESASFQAMIAKAHAAFPNLTVIATTLRGVHSATVNDWNAVAWSPDIGFVVATARGNLEILDRVGGGDSFASGLIYALLSGHDVDAAVEYGAAHGALAMTTAGDTSMARLAEVEALVAGAGARVQR
jgi:2-dehydro-3-deoxygluconokinase